MRCKFKLNSITISMGTVTKLDAEGNPAVDEGGRRLTEMGEVRTLKFSPVYANNDPKHENSKFWAYSPGGSFELSTVNKAAVDGLELDGEYYLDIKRAP